jgi:N-acetylmuramoyl-L-alanine amidase
MHGSRTYFLFVMLMIAIGGCAQMPRAAQEKMGTRAMPVDTSYVSKSQDSRVQYIILHFTTIDLTKSLNVLTEGAVSSHYLVGENPPTLYQLVDENRRAFHAGVSSWKNASLLNASSIGIEIVNLGYKNTPNGRVWFDFPKAQIDVVIALVKDIAARHGVKPDRILGHSDIAPGRKSDPGPKFPWKRFADEGLIPWPDAAMVAARRVVYESALPDVKWFQQQLLKHGYSTPQSGELDEGTRNAIEAFQMRYRQEKFDGNPDAESAAILDVLVTSAQPQIPSTAPVPVPAPAKASGQN